MTVSTAVFGTVTLPGEVAAREDVAVVTLVHSSTPHALLSSNAAAASIRSLATFLRAAQILGVVGPTTTVVEGRVALVVCGTPIALCRRLRAREAVIVIFVAALLQGIPLPVTVIVATQSTASVVAIAPRAVTCSSTLSATGELLAAIVLRSSSVRARVAIVLVETTTGGGAIGTIVMRSAYQTSLMTVGNAGISSNALRYCTNSNHYH